MQNGRGSKKDLRASLRGISVVLPDILLVTRFSFLYKGAASLSIRGHRAFSSATNFGRQAGLAKASFRE